jgi:NADP-dependent aldehyde dehydrogenase
MNITGSQLIDGQAVQGKGTPFSGKNPARGETMTPEFSGATTADVAQACAAAAAAFRTYRATTPAARAKFLEEIATQILALGDALIERAVAESGLPRGRIEGERGRTVGQLRLFAAVVREGSDTEARIDPAMPERKPAPRSDLRQMHIGLGPVAVFGASNFPLAFSVAGGDTAAALAAGCPVVVKGHPAHPGTSELVGRAIQAAVAACDLPAGVFSLLQGPDNALGGALVADPHIAAVGFTGSRRGGLALVEIAARRAVPIPVYAEMSSINPVFLLPAALKARAESIAQGYVGSVTLGAGQFCTNPGLVFAVQSPGLDQFVEAAHKAILSAQPAAMLTSGIQAAYTHGVEALSGEPGVKCLGVSETAAGPGQGRPTLFVTDLANFLSRPRLSEEVFGAASLIVACPDAEAMHQAISHLEGQLTVTLQIDPDDYAQAATLLPALEEKAGRILVNGFPTGVEVCHAMVHGGPFPATSDGKSTSVGSLAIRRFLRPVCYQDLPAALLPAALQPENPLNLWRRLDGELQKA